MKNNYWIKKYKYKFCQKQLYRLKGVTNRNFIANQMFSYVLKALSSIFLFAAQLESGRRIMRHFIKKFIKININLLCNKSISKKSNGVRMGKGKGNLEEWVNCLKVGVLLYTIRNLNFFQSIYLLDKASRKFNFKTYIYQIDLKKSTLLKNNLYY